MAELESSSTSGTSVPIPGLPEDWHLKATDQIVDKVDLVRQKTAGPAIGIARKAVFGVLTAILGTIALIILVIGLIRVLDVILPSSVWLPYVILGSIFTLIGLFLWSKRPKGVAE